MFFLYKIRPSVVQTFLTPFVAIKHSLIKTFFSFWFLFIFAHCTIHIITSTLNNYGPWFTLLSGCQHDVCDPDLPLVYWYSFALWQFLLFHHLYFCLLILKHHVTTYNFYKNAVLIHLHYPTILSLTIQLCSKVQKFLSFFARSFSKSSYFAESNSNTSAKASGSSWSTKNCFTCNSATFKQLVNILAHSGELKPKL